MKNVAGVTFLLYHAVRDRLGSLSLFFALCAVAVKLYMAPKHFKILSQLFRKINGQSLGNIYNLAAMDAHKVMVPAYIGIETFSHGVDRQLTYRSCLCERIERVIDSREGHGMILFRYRAIDVIC